MNTGWTIFPPINRAPDVTCAKQDFSEYMNLCQHQCYLLSFLMADTTSANSPNYEVYSQHDGISVIPDHIKSYISGLLIAVYCSCKIIQESYQLHTWIIHYYTLHTALWADWETFLIPRQFNSLSSWKILPAVMQHLTSCPQLLTSNMP